MRLEFYPRWTRVPQGWYSLKYWEDKTKKAGHFLRHPALLIFRSYALRLSCKRGSYVYQTISLQSSWLLRTYDW